MIPIPAPGQIVHCIKGDEPVFKINDNTQAGEMVQACIDAVGDQKWPVEGDIFTCSKCEEPIDFSNFR